MILKNNKRIDGCSDTVPIGTLNPFLGSIAPYGYLICQGQKVSKIIYKELYAICGDTFGQSTDTEFYLPDLRGRAIAGYKEGDSTFGTLGALIGSLIHLHSTGNHTLTIAEMPSHSHNADNYCIGAPSGSSREGEYYTLLKPYGSSIIYPLENAVTNVGGSEAHNHGDTSSASSVQPTIVLNWIVKAFQLMPNQSYVENSLESNSAINSLSAAKGKVLNDKISNLSKVAVSGSYNDLINKPTRMDYTNQVTCSYGKLNNNFNYCFLKDGIVYINLSYILSQSLTAGTQYDFAMLPTSVRPKGNVVITAFSHKTSHMAGSYIRNTGEIVIVPEKAVAEGKEINIFAEYFIK